MAIKRVHVLAKLLERAFGRAPALAAFKREGARDDADGQRADLAADGGDHGRCAGTGAAAHARGHEDHVRAFQAFL